MEAEGPIAKHLPHIPHGVFPALSAALFISMAYIDPGKWAASIDSGARFGGDLAVYLFLFNIGAFICQYLSVQIGLVSGKNLAQICSVEYDQLNRTFLGIQAEVSIIMSDLAMILGNANGLHMILGVDLFSAVIFTALDALLYPLLSTLLVNSKAKGLVVRIAGLTFVFYVLAMLIGLPETSIPPIAVLSEFSGEKVYALMSLLGANIIPHNFYLHSSIVQRFQGSPGEAIAQQASVNFYSTGAIFSSIFLVNYIMMNSASNVFYSYGVVLPTFQDAMSLMEESIWSPMKPLAFLLLISSSHISGLSWEINGKDRQTILYNFFEIDLPVWLHCVAVRIFAIIPALFCVWYSGAEGMYQMLISTQIMVALLLPASVVALYRVASSGALMGAYKISRVMEFFMMLSSLAMIVLQITFLREMVFGDSAWLGYLRWNMGTTRISSPHFIFIVIGSASLFLTYRLFAAPLRSSEKVVESHSEPCITPDGIEDCSDDQCVASSEPKVDAVDGEPATRKDGEEGEAREPEEVSKEVSEVAPAVIPERHLGLTRSARRQLTTILDDFWGQLYDYHGQFTRDAKAKKLDLLLGAKSNSKPAPSSEKVVETPSDAPTSIRQRLPSNIGSACGVPKVPPSPSLLSDQTQVQVIQAYMQKLGGNALDGFMNGQPRSSSLLPKPTNRQRLQPNLALRVPPPGFDKIPSRKPCREVVFPSRCISGVDDESLWHKQPYERVGIDYKTTLGAASAGQKSLVKVESATKAVDSAIKLLQSLRDCMLKLLKLDGSEWLFRLTDCADEDLVERVAARERLNEDSPGASTAAKGDVKYVASPLPDCGEGCVWKPDLIVSFGVWCIHRILELSRMESRPEMWGKYTFVLNRLQGVVDQAFFGQRSPTFSCPCVPFSTEELPSTPRSPHGKFTTAPALLDMIKEIEAFISTRKGRTGTVAGDVAFPKGKENLASVLKRYKRRLSTKPVIAQDRGKQILPSDPFAS